MDSRRLSEDSIIERLLELFRTEHPRIIKAIGDDTSVTAITEKRCLLATIDTLVEDVHFKRVYSPPYYIGRKAVSVSVSDIAAMGGTPLYILTALCLPAETEPDFVDTLYRGIKDATQEYGIHLVGGNTSRADTISITTTLLGEAERQKVIYRAGAMPEDVIYITGTVGDSALGLKILKEMGQKALEKEGIKEVALKHLNPVARVGVARQIAEKGLASAMIDVSDGLIRDLKHITEESGVGAIVECEGLPLSEQMLAYRVTTEQRLRLALTGGEDYELLFTAPAKNREAIEQIGKRFSTRITPIGVVTKEKGVKVLCGGRELSVDPEGGYQHFIS